MPNEELIQTLLRALPADLAVQLEANESFRPWVSREIEAALSAWPGVDLPLDRFIAYLAAHFPRGTDIERTLANWKLDDLYLCCACADGLPEALRQFDRRYGRVLQAAMSRQGLSGTLLEEAKQAVSVALFSGTDTAPPQITRYTGPGELGSWLWVVASRNGRKLLAKERKFVTVETGEIAARLMGQHGGQPSTEVALSRERHRAAFKRCFRRAMESLSERQLLLLRYHYGDGFGMREIGRIYRVHASTASRWIEQVRCTLRERTQAALSDELGASPAACASIVGLFQREFEVSITTLFETPPNESDRP